MALVPVTTKQLADYKTEVIRLERELRSALDGAVEEINSQALDSIQRQLDGIADKYGPTDVGKLFYKTYEIQAYIHFLQGRPEKALQFINEAIRIRARPYSEANALINEIGIKRHQRDTYIQREIKSKAKKQILIGSVWLVIGLVATLISYDASGNSAEQEAIANNQSEYNFTYTALIGPMLYGGYKILIGISDYVNVIEKTRDIVSQLETE